jgi:hypothetical protein
VDVRQLKHSIWENVAEGGAEAADEPKTFQGVVANLYAAAHTRSLCCRGCRR